MVRLAIHKCYEFLDIMDVYENEVMKYDPHTRKRVYWRSIETRSLNLKMRRAVTPAGFQTLKTRNGSFRISMPDSACGLIG